MHNDYIKTIVEKLSSQTKDSIIGAIETTWNIYHSKEKNLPLRSPEHIDKVMLITYNPYTICLGLVVAKEVQSNHYKKLTTNDCRDIATLWSNSENLLDEDLTKKEISEMVTHLKDIQKKEKDFLTFPIHEEQFMNLILVVFLQRKVTQQNKHINFFSGKEFAKIFYILKKLNNKLNEEIENFFQREFSVSILQFIRIVSIFAKGTGGHITLNSNLDDALHQTLHINTSMCNKVFSLISIEIKDLKKWYEDYIQSNHSYKSISALPLITQSPIIKINEDKKEYIIPCPYICQKYISEIIFRKLGKIDKNKVKDIYTEIGDSLENYLEQFLELTFKNVSKVPANSERKEADFIIEHPSCTIIIECKTSISSIKDGLEYSPKGSAQIWFRTYSALQQIMSTAERIKNENHTKPIIGIIVFGNYTLESLALQHYLKSINFFDNKALSWFEPLSLSNLESFLAEVNSTEFIYKIFQRYKEKNTNVLQITRSQKWNRPAHNYEYLKAEINELFG